MRSPLVRVETAPIIFIVVDLPAPFGPEQAEGLPRRDLERQAVDGEEVGLALDLVGLHEVRRGDDGSRHRTTLPAAAGHPGEARSVNSS